jgi:hypothetical protein
MRRAVIASPLQQPPVQRLLHDDESEIANQIDAVIQTVDQRGVPEVSDMGGVTTIAFGNDVGNAQRGQVFRLSR